MEKPPLAAEFPSNWAIRGVVTPARVSLQYRLATALVAVAMVLLPVVYLGIIWVVAQWVAQYATEGPGVKGGLLALLILYLGPLLVGFILILFMIKPLFQRRAQTVKPRELHAADEPGLFAFIYAVCDLVKAPRPRKVLVDLDVNASARLTHGLWSIVSRNLTLAIGLPLAGGLSVREFGGVLAHEFGHFAQGAGMGTTYIVRTISMWFARVVYERDRWDATLDAWARESDWRLMIVLQLARFAIWIVRRILWVLMMIGQFLSSVLMRQMEFDADHYEIQASGSEAFIATARRLRIMAVGAQITHGKQDEAFVAKRLVDDLPGWVLHETAAMPAETCAKVLAAVAEQKTGWLDSHPSDAERIARANAAKSSGVLSGDAPGSVLFADFAALSREVTQLLYRQVLELPEKEFAVESLEKMTAESSAMQRGDAALDQVFHGLVTTHSMVFLGPQDVTPAVGESPALPPPAEPDAASVAEVETVAKSLQEAATRLREMHGAAGMLSAEIPIDRAAFKLVSGSPDEVEEEEKKLEETIEKLAAHGELQRARARLAATLRWLLAQPETPVDLITEVTLLAATLGRIQAVAEPLACMRPLAATMGAILNHYERTASKGAAYGVLERKAGSLGLHADKVLAALRDVRFPFEHAQGLVRIGDYLVDGISHPETVVRAYLRGGTILDRLDGIYGRALGRLCAIALEVEGRIDARHAGNEPAAPTKD